MIFFFQMTEAIPQLCPPSMKNIIRQIDESYYHLGYLAHQIGTAVGKHRADLASVIKPLCLDLESSQRSTAYAYQILTQTCSAIASERDGLSDELRVIKTSGQKPQSSYSTVPDDAKDCLYVQSDDRPLNEDILTDASLISLPESDCEPSEDGGTDETLESWVQREAAESARISLQESHDNENGNVTEGVEYAAKSRHASAKRTAPPSSSHWLVEPSRAEKRQRSN